MFIDTDIHILKRIEQDSCHPNVVGEFCLVSPALLRQHGSFLFRPYIINKIKKGIKMKKNQNLMAMDAGRMTSLEIATIIGKQHKNVMQAIRNMEPAWEQERGLKFQLTQIREEIPNGGYRLRPVFVLSRRRKERTCLSGVDSAGM